MLISLKELQYDRKQTLFTHDIIIWRRLASPWYPTTDLFEISFGNSLPSFTRKCFIVPEKNVISWNVLDEKSKFRFDVWHLSQTSIFSKIEFWALGTRFQIQNGFYELNRAQTIKLASQDSLPDENITEKNRLMAEDPNNLPSSLLGNAIDFQ